MAGGKEGEGEKEGTGDRRTGMRKGWEGKNVWVNEEEEGLKKKNDRWVMRRKGKAEI